MTFKIFNYVKEFHYTFSKKKYFCGLLAGVQSNEVGGSYHMEKEGLKRSLALLDARGVTVDCIVTDRHPQIQKFLRENNVTHYYDVWHIAKGTSIGFHFHPHPQLLHLAYFITTNVFLMHVGISKKLDKISKMKDCEKLQKWMKSINNHIYWTAATSTTGPERVAKWTSILNHVQDIHEHDDPLFPACLHESRQTREKKKWLSAGLDKKIDVSSFLSYCSGLYYIKTTSLCETFGN